MIGGLSSSMRRALALAILAALLLGIGGLVWLPFAILQRQDSEIVRLDERMDELEARLRGREQLLAEQRLLERASQADQTLAQAGTPALAGAELQRVLTELVAAGGGALESVQVLEPAQRLPFMQISVRLSFTSSIEALRQFLYAVEDHAPVLLVHDLSITEAVAYDAMGDPLPSQLYSTVEIQAFTRAQAPS